MGGLGSTLIGCKCEPEDADECLPEVLLPSSVLARHLLPFLEPSTMLCVFGNVCRAWAYVVRKSSRMWLDGRFISGFQSVLRADLVLQWSAGSASGLLQSQHEVGCSEDLKSKTLTRKGVGTSMTCQRLSAWLASRTTDAHHNTVKTWVQLLATEAPANIDLWAAMSHWSDGATVATDRLVELRMGGEHICSLRLFCCNTTPR